MSEINSPTSDLRHWQVAGGILVRDESVLLVENVRRNGSVDWSTPGGVVDAGETSIQGLTREVQEETGLLVSAWSDVMYQVVVVAPDAGFRLEVDAFVALEVSGDLEIDDPDGIVVSAKYVPISELNTHMDDGPRWVSEPLISHLTSVVEHGHVFEYQVTGKGKDRSVARLDEF